MYQSQDNEYGDTNGLDRPRLGASRCSDWSLGFLRFQKSGNVPFDEEAFHVRRHDKVNMSEDLHNL